MIDTLVGFMDGIAFGLAHLMPEPHSRIDLVYRPEINIWRGNERLQLNVKALRPAE